MKKQTLIITIIVLLGLLFMLTNVVIASESASYLIGWDVLASGRDVSQSSSYSLNATVGEQIIGFSSGDSYQVEAGYWYGKENIPLETRSVYLPVVVRDR